MRKRPSGSSCELQYTLKQHDPTTQLFYVSDYTFSCRALTAVPMCKTFSFLHPRQAQRFANAGPGFKLGPRPRFSDHTPRRLAQASSTARSMRQTDATACHAVASDHTHSTPPHTLLINRGVSKASSSREKQHTHGHYIGMYCTRSLATICSGSKHVDQRRIAQIQSLHRRYERKLKGMVKKCGCDMARSWRSATHYVPAASPFPSCSSP